ncbi:MAG: pectate lyase [Cyclobacteriaceae bacterium]|nr:pectate lyase [Cyclobacteriaceae bacterium]
MPVDGPVQIVEEAFAFPGAEGFGNKTTGGRGGQVIKVTNLNDSGAGSLRAAISSSGARIVVFEVSGTIELLSNLNITNPNITIAGQTAPGDGITIKNYPVFVGADNVIIRFLRFRMGNEKQVEGDAIWGRYRKNVVIDHCSMSWCTDEAASFYANQDFTMQWCIISESLNRSLHDKGDHGYGGIWGGDRASFHHNLMAHHKSRTPRFNGFRSGTYSAGNPYPNEHVDYRNNVVYNWVGEGTYGGENGNYNMVNNYYKSGPATTSNQSRILVAYKEVFQDRSGDGKFYIDGNHVHGSAAVTANNWSGVTYKNGATEVASKLNTPLSVTMITPHTAQQAYEKVLTHAGASLKRDAVDIRVVEEVSTGIANYNGSETGLPGIIDSQEDVGGWPDLTSLPPLLDTDGDGMPDAWEIEMKLDPNTPNANGRDLSSAYDNIEVYINSIVKSIIEGQNQ